jgi:hypothetical protein
MGKLESDSAKEATWRNHLARHAASGMSIAAFCRAEGISAANFYAWRARLANEVHDRIVRPMPQSGFIDIGAVNGVVESGATGHSPAPTSPARSLGTDIRIDLGDGIVLTITRR